jgi:unsaturated rhamnogalacturonyl hydrolase
MLILFALLVLYAKELTTSPATRWSVRIADSFLARHPDMNLTDSTGQAQKWDYEQGLMLLALSRMWQHTGNEKYIDAVRKNLEQFVGEKGNIRTYELDDFKLDNILPGRALLVVYQKTGEQRMREAADMLRRQLREQPRTAEGGFWHKKIYPSQMWLDGLYMAEPYYATYARLFDEPKAYDDIINQFVWMADHARDPKTGLLFHGWDESRRQQWANPTTGCSPVLWGRAMGWYAMALVDVLDEIPADHPRRNELAGLVKNLADGIVKYRDDKTHLWYQVVDQGGRSGNYPESSASCMFSYFLAKGAARGYLDRKYAALATETFDGILQYEVTVDSAGNVDLHGTCGSTGLGGTPYRDGSFEYYTHLPQRTNDMRGVGSFLLAAIELEEGDSAVVTGKSGRLDAPPASIRKGTHQ